MRRYYFDGQIQENKPKALQGKRLICLCLVCCVALFAAFAVSCGSINFGEVQPQDLCKCAPLEPDIADFRHDEKHVAIPTMTPEEITVDTILGWPQDEIVLPDAPRTGRELQVFHVAQSFLQNVHVRLSPGGPVH